MSNHDEDEQLDTGIHPLEAEAPHEHHDGCCHGEEEESEWADHKAGHEYDVAAEKDKSSLKIVEAEGTGWEKPKRGDDVHVNYVGRLYDTKVEFDRGTDFTFKLGVGQVIKGWDEGVASMKKGEKAKLILQPHKAYGAGGSPPTIPPNATLEFDVELLHWSNEKDLTKHKDGGVMVKALDEGEGWERPRDLGRLSLHYKLYDMHTNECLTDTYKDNAPLSFTLDQLDPPAALFSGLEMVARDLKLNGSCDATIQSAYGPNNRAVVLKECRLIEMKNPRETWDMKVPEKLSHCEELRQLGNECFKRGDVERAVRRYEAAHSAVQYLGADATSEETAESKKKILPIMLNLAQCFIKKNEWEKVSEKAKAALDIDASNVKALYRMGLAQHHLNDLVEAKRHLKRAAEIDPKDPAVRTELNAVLGKIKAQEQKEKKMFGGMFSKLSGFASDDRKETAPAPKEEGMPMSDSEDDEMPPLEEGGVTAAPHSA